MTGMCRTPQNKIVEGPNSMEVIVTDIQAQKLLSNGTTVQLVAVTQKLVVMVMYGDSHKQTDDG
jgi:hypothetical protein